MKWRESQIVKTDDIPAIATIGGDVLCGLVGACHIAGCERDTFAKSRLRLAQQCDRIAQSLAGDRADGSILRLQQLLCLR